MAIVNMKMDGFEHVINALQAVDTQLNREIKGAMEAGGQVILDSAKEFASAGGSHPQVITGALLEAIEMKAKASKSGAEVKVGVFGGQSAKKRSANGYSAQDYAWMVEHGHGVHHSSGQAAPHPFMEPAYEATKGEAMDVIAEHLREAIGL